MKVEAPPVARHIFDRLCRGDNLILSLNGPDDDADLFRQVEADEPGCIEYFEVLGFCLHKGDNCYYFSTKDDALSNLETKLGKMVSLVRLLDFLSTHVESFSEGVTFSAATLTARCNGNPKAERFLHETGKGASNAERLENLLQSLVRQGYLSEFDRSRQEYRVLSAINYLFDFADRILIHEEEPDSQITDAGT